MKLEEFLKLDLSLLKGKVVCFPTDTVYGVGAILIDKEGIDKIYQIKGRDLDKPLAVLASSKEDINKIVKPYNDKVEKLIDKYLPGALTIIFDKKDEIKTEATKTNTIGIRIPNSKIALEVLKKCGPMATTSVNISGEEPLNDLESIFNVFGNKIDYYIEDVEMNTSKISSTVVKPSNDGFIVLRQGTIKVEEN